MQGQGASLVPQPMSCQTLRVLLTHLGAASVSPSVEGVCFYITMETQKVQTEAPPGPRGGWPVPAWILTLLSAGMLSHGVTG